MLLLFFWLLKIASVNLLSGILLPVFFARLIQATSRQIVELYRTAM